MSLDINSFTTLIPISFVIITAFTYFFGRIIGDTQPGIYDKHEYYFKGGSFIFNVILLPSIIIHISVVGVGLYEKLNSLKFKELILGMLVILVILIILQAIFLYYLQLKVQKLDELNPRISFFGKECSSEFIAIISYAATCLNYIILYISFYIFVKDPNLEPFLSLLVVFSVSSAFIIYVLLALIYGCSFVEYPYVRILLRNGQPFSGNIMSFGEYITLVTEDKIYNINKDEICFIEKSIDYLREPSLEESNDQKDQCKLITE